MWTGWGAATPGSGLKAAPARGREPLLDFEGPTAAICDTNTSLVLSSPNSEENLRARLIRRGRLVQHGRGLGIGRQASGTAIGPQFNQPAIGPQFNEPVIGPQANQPMIAPQSNEPTIAPQFNEPTIAPQPDEPTVGQQGIIAGEAGSIPVRSPLVPGQQGTVNSGMMMGPQGGVLGQQQSAVSPGGTSARPGLRLSAPAGGRSSAGAPAAAGGRR